MKTIHERERYQQLLLQVVFPEDPQKIESLLLGLLDYCDPGEILFDVVCAQESKV
jgi:hypothetical protein